MEARMVHLAEVLGLAWPAPADRPRP
jgi:hypothetical protein